jgi:MFS family permease
MSGSGLKERARRIGANRVVLALSFARLGDAVGNTILMVVLPLYVDVLPSPLVSASETMRVGFLLAVYGLVAAVVQPLVGMLSDHMGRRKWLVQLGLAVMATATFSFDFAGTYSQLLWMRAAQGLGVALTVPAAMALLASGTVRETRGGSMGIYTTARMIGLGVGPLVGGGLHDLFGFSAAFYTGAAAIALSLVIVQLGVHERPVRPSNQPPKHHSHAVRFFDRSMLALGFATAVMSATFTMMSTLEKQFNERLNESAFAFSLAFSALMLTRLVFQIPFGRLSDRIGRKPLVIIGLVLLAPSTALLGFAASTWELAGLRLVQGLAAAAVAAPSFALVGDLTHGGSEARHMSVVTSGFTLGIAVGPLLAGVLAPIVFHLPFIVGGVLCLLAAWAVHRFAPETTGRRAER